jgi:asparagine synthase (glutamine-hydrolysing)
VRQGRYWRLPPPAEHFPAGQPAPSEQEVCESLRNLFDESVRIRMIADVPLGAFLSGGIDSSAVVAMMSRHMGQAVKTFSIGFAEHAYNELPAARIVADLFHTDHTEFRVNVEAVEMVPKLVRSYDEPFAADSAIPTFLLSKLARSHVTVILNGDAGDENFAGYDRHVANDLATRLRGVATLLGSGPARRLLEAMPHGPGPRDVRWRLKRFVHRLGQSPGARNAGWQSRFGPLEKARLYTEAFKRRVLEVDSHELLFARYREAEGADFLDEVLYSDVTTYLPDCLLVKVDIATMAHGLEARSPFVDHEVMEFCARLPSEFKLRGQVKKYLLKQAATRYLPASIIDRPKMGFGVPLDRWFRHELQDLARDTLLGPPASERGYFRLDVVRRLLDEHVAGTHHRHYQLWNLLVLELWHRAFIDRGGRP